jgi:hypothetical protein
MQQMMFSFNLLSNFKLNCFGTCHFQFHLATFKLNCFTFSVPIRFPYSLLYKSNQYRLPVLLTIWKFTSTKVIKIVIMPYISHLLTTTHLRHKEIQSIVYTQRKERKKTSDISGLRWLLWWDCCCRIEFSEIFTWFRYCHYLNSDKYWSTAGLVFTI